MRSIAARGLLGALLCLAAACQPTPAAVRVERTVFLMGTVATFVAEAPDREIGVTKLERMVRVIEETEAELSTWRDDSVLSALNRQPVDTWLTLPESACVLLDQVAAWHRATEGAFDPAVGRLIDAWALRDAGHVPHADAIAKAKARSGFQHVVVDPERCAASRSADVRLDAGGFGKGAALERVRRAEQGEPGAWLIDFGGQVAVSSRSAEGAWSVALAHPEHREMPVVELSLDEGSLATTGGSERDVVIDADTRIGHVIDPRTGATVSRPSSVTVWHRDALAADILSTALYVMGPDDALPWAEAHGIAAYVLTADAATGDVVHAATDAFTVRFLPSDGAAGPVRRKPAPAPVRGRRSG